MQDDFQRAMERGDKLDLARWVALGEIIHVCNSSAEISHARGCKECVSLIRHSKMDVVVSHIFRKGHLEVLCLILRPRDECVTNTEEPESDHLAIAVFDVQVKIRIGVCFPIEELKSCGS